MKEVMKVREFQQRARSNLPPDVFSYFSSGADEQVTLKQNEVAFKRLKLFKRMISNFSLVSLQSRILGKNVGLPFGFAPSAMHKLAHIEGEAITAEVAHQEDLCFVLSTLSTVSLKEIQRVNQTGIRLLQLYILKDRKVTEILVHLAEKYGFTGLVITVDAQVIGKRISDERNKFISPKEIKLEIVEQIHSELKRYPENEAYQRRYLTKERDLSLDWSFISWLKAITRLPIVIKGIMSIQDAELACESKVDGVWVSNHGGRQLDCVSATIEVLPSIASFVKTKYPGVQVYVDGGVRKGSDVFKCLALGADYVFLGRPVVYSLVDGKEGISRMVDIIKMELKRKMMMSGVKTIGEIKEIVDPIQSRL